MTPNVSPTSRDRLPDDFIPACVQRSPLFRAGGFQVFDGPLGDAGVARLLSEALRLSPQARRSHVNEPDCEEARGGVPPRRFASVPGATEQDAFYQAPWMIAWLQQLTGVPIAPSGGRGTYSFYARPGDFLGIHRDVHACDLAVITCLHDGPRASETSGTLRAYPGRILEKLSAIRDEPEVAKVEFRLQPGQTVVMFGGVLPHATQPVDAGQVRIVSVLCYQIAPEPAAGRR